MRFSAGGRRRFPGGSTHAAPEEALGRRLVFTAKRVRHRFEQHLARSGARLATWVVLTHARRMPSWQRRSWPS